MQRFLQNVFFIRTDEGIKYFVAKVLGGILIYSVVIGVGLAIIKLVVNIARYSKSETASICKPFSRICSTIQQRADFFKRGVWLVMPVGALLIISILLILCGIEVIKVSPSSNFDTLCSAGLLLFLATFIYFAILYFKRGNYEALNGFFDNKMKSFVPKKVLITDTYEDYTHVGHKEESLTATKNAGIAAGNVFITIFNIILFFAHVLIFAFANILKGVYFVITIPLSFNLKSRARKALRENLFRDEGKATVFFRGQSAGGTIPYPQSQLEEDLYFEEAESIVADYTKKLKNREDIVDISCINGRTLFNSDWTNDFTYYHTTKFMTEVPGDGVQLLFYETNLGVLLIEEKYSTGQYLVNNFYPFHPAQSWIDQYNSSSTTQAYRENVRMLQNAYIAYKKATEADYSHKLTLLYDETPDSDKSNAFLIFASLADLTPNPQDNWSQFTVTEYARIRAKKGKYVNKYNNGSGVSSTVRTIVAFIISLFSPFVGFLLFIFDFKKAKKNKSSTKTATFGIIFCVTIMLITVIYLLVTNSQGEM